MNKRVVKLHNETTLWPAHKSEAEVLELKATTPIHIFQTTYQGFPTNPSGNIFKREWFDKRWISDTHEQPIARWMSMDTALSDSESAAMSAIVVGELTPYYELNTLEVWAERVQFPQLVEVTGQFANRYKDERFQGIIVEKKASGFSLIQTLKQSGDPWMSKKILEYTPKYNKETRWSEAAVWCSLFMVRLPPPSPVNPWLYDFEQDLFEAPDIPFKDRLDAFAQLVLYIQHYLSAGYKASRGD
jgi:phage terminase large subunit-like protein